MSGRLPQGRDARDVAIRAHARGRGPEANLEHFPMIRNRNMLCKSLLCRVFEPENRDVVPLAQPGCGAHFS